LAPRFFQKHNNAALILFPRFTEIVNSYLHSSSSKQATKEKQWIANEHPTVLGKLNDLDLPRGSIQLLLELVLPSPSSFIQH